MTSSCTWVCGLANLLCGTKCVYMCVYCVWWGCMVTPVWKIGVICFVCVFLCNLFGAPLTYPQPSLNPPSTLPQPSLNPPPNLLRTVPRYVTSRAVFQLCFVAQERARLLSARIHHTLCHMFEGVCSYINLVLNVSNPTNPYRILNNNLNTIKALLLRKRKREHHSLFMHSFI